MTCSVDLLLKMPSVTAQLGFLTPNPAYAYLAVPFLCQPSSGWHSEALQTSRSSRCIESYSARRGHKNARCCSTHVGEFGVLYGWRPHQGIQQYRSWDRVTMHPRQGCVRTLRETLNPSDSLGNNNEFKGSLQRHQHWPERCTAVIYQFGLHGKGNEERSVSDRLHRLLHLDSTRRLLSPEVVVTFTSLNFLIVHRRNDQFCLDDYLQSTKRRRRGSSSRRARFDLGLRRWEVCGFHDQEGDIGSLEGVIKSVATPLSATRVSSLEVISEEHRRMNKSSENIVVRQEAWQRRLLRLYFRVRCALALARTSATAARTRSSLNPLLFIRVGQLMSRRDCDSILAEAQGSGDWQPWEGDLGEGCAARCLEDLPKSWALWEGRLGKDVHARIARTYGVAQSNVVSDASAVFVCRSSSSDNVLVENEGMHHANRIMQQHHDRGRHAINSSDFRRSRSLVSFSVQLSAHDTGEPLWAVCFEEQGRCVMPGGQGGGVIFSGKMRHACLCTQSQAVRGGELSTEDYSNSTPISASVVILRGFADLCGPQIRDGFTRGDWGHPPWNVNASWVKETEILNRVWIASTPRAVDEGKRLERMNSSLAHRYYRQGLGGMNIPLVDDLGRPVVDLHEEGPPRWIPGSRRAGAEFKITAALRRRHAWYFRRQVIGRAGLSTEAGASPRMDSALRELFGDGERRFEGERVPPIKYVFVDPRYRGFGLGRRLFLEAMCSLAKRGFRFVLIVVEDSGSGSLFGFYERMGFVFAEEQLGLPRAMIAPIPPSDRIMTADK